ncbi:hypothetical protein EB796_020854 [Bugula neritina]|uniref:Uncharacterized protein n=1 Tax=Bugula neritina TaxID=10212 RepID=A0A7J7J4L5_BUGNE|nr:hypothetical protein EB796_020854 [Bugula neritina]
MELANSCCPYSCCNTGHQTCSVVKTYDAIHLYILAIFISYTLYYFIFSGVLEIILYIFGLLLNGSCSLQCNPTQYGQLNIYLK